MVGTVGTVVDDGPSIGTVIVGRSVEIWMSNSSNCSSVIWSRVGPDVVLRAAVSAASVHVVSVDVLLPQTMLSSAALLPQTMLSTSKLPQTRLSQPSLRQPLPHTMLSPLSACAAPHTTPLCHAFASGSGTPPDSMWLPQTMCLLHIACIGTVSPGWAVA